ncbi:MAG TPA: LapA family protein [Burkholderiaceae bacterium]|nr:LapA family protein [Burkholderiaceae bacterium]
MRWKVILGLAVVLLVAVVATQNSAALTVRFLFWSVELPQALVIFFSGAAGVVAGLLLAATGALKK